MSKPVSDVAKRFIVAIGREHRDLASPRAALEVLKPAFQKGKLDPRRFVIGIEGIYQNPEASRVMPILEPLIKSSGVGVVSSVVDKIIPRKPENELRRMNILDSLTTYSMLNFCKDFGLNYFQLDSREVTAQMDKAGRSAGPEMRTALEIHFDKARTDAMMENLKTAIHKHDPQFLLLVLGGLHVPFIARKCKDLNDKHNIVETVPMAMVSRQLVDEMGMASEGEVFAALDNHGKFLTEAIMSYHKDPKPDEVLQMMKKTKKLSVGKDGNFVDGEFSKIIDQVADFLSSPSPSPSKAGKEKLAEDEKESTSR